MAQRRVTTPKGKNIVVPDDFTPEEEARAVEIEDSQIGQSDSKTLHMRSIADMSGDHDPLGMFPRDPNTGDRLKSTLHAPPRGTLPVLAGLASGLIPGGGLVRGLGMMAAGGAGEAVDEAIHGEPIDGGKILTEAATQGVLGGVSKVPSALRAGGQKAVLNAGLSTAQRINRPNPTMGELGMDMVSKFPYFGQVGMNAAGHTMYKAGQMARKAPSVVKDALSSSALRNIQLLYRVLANKQDQQ